MVVLEYRIPLPLSVEEFHIAQLFMVIKASEENTKDGEGVEILENKPYENADGSLGSSEISGIVIPKNNGQYTLKRYFIGSRIPSVIRAMLPSNAMFLVEEAWNAYPHCRTILTSAYLSKEKFVIDIETLHVDGNVELDNALNLTPQELEMRKVISIDIGKTDTIDQNVKNEYDATKFHSKITGRGPLKEDWLNTMQPIMRAYKVVRTFFKYFGLQKKIESLIENQQTTLFSSTLSQSFCLIDSWYNLTIDDIRQLENKAKEQLKENMEKHSQNSKNDLALSHRKEALA